MKQVKASKGKQSPRKGTNIRLSEIDYNRIKTFCDEKGYKIGRFVSYAAIKRILSETEQQS